MSVEKGVQNMDRFVTPSHYVGMLRREMGSNLDPHIAGVLHARVEEVLALSQQAGRMSTAQLAQDISLIQRGIDHPNQMGLAPFTNDYSRASRDGARPLPR